jgi:hypothetical protein
LWNKETSVAAEISRRDYKCSLVDCRHPAEKTITGNQMN